MLPVHYLTAYKGVGKDAHRAILRLFDELRQALQMTLWRWPC